MSLDGLARQSVLWQDHIGGLARLMEEESYSTAYETLKLLFLNPQVSEGLIQQSWTHFLKLVSHLDHRQQHDLLHAALNKLALFPALVEERIAVLKLAGDFHAGEDLSVALHHYTSALALSPREAIHEAISNLFSRLSQQKFPELLDRAVRRGAEPFERLLHTIPHRHQCFSSQPDEIKTYYAQATTALAHISPEAHHHLGHLSAYVLAERNRVVPVPLTSSQRYHQELLTIRSIFAEPLLAQEMQEKSFLHLTAFLKSLFEEAILLLGEPPCHFDIRLTGSWARREICPYSDVEYFILIDDARHRPYFKQLAQIFEMQILALGESDHGYVVPRYTERFGLQIDPQSNPARDDSLILVSQDFAQAAHDPESLKALSSSLCSYSLLSKDLVLQPETYQEIGSQLIRQLKDDWKDINPFSGKTINLKEQFTAPLIYLLRGYALYHSISETNTLAAIDQLPVFDEQSKVLLKEAVSAIYKIRVRLHLQHGALQETASLIPSLEFPVLSQEEKYILGQAYHLVIAPLYGVNLEDRHVDLIEVAFRNASSSAVHHASLFLARQGGLHEKYYRMLLAPDQVSLQKTYLDQIPQPIAHNLAQIPNRAGYRQAMRFDEERLIARLAALTTDNPASGVKVRCPLLGERYLTSQAADALLKNGHIKKAYAKSLHNVAQHGGLHFKELPYQPLMEYAIHSLTYRIMGKATPTTTLARFEVNGFVYPVLISETIVGLEPQADVKLNLRHLTGLRLCEILTKPGDGRLSNYIVSGQEIFCIDNDISFMEPVIKERLGRKIAFCSALFTLNAPLDPQVLRDFCALEPDLILNDWLQELQSREEAYTRLFSEAELKTLYDQDKERRFSPRILFPQGSIANLCLQFYHLQDVLRQSVFEGPHLLLREMISLNESDKSQVGILVESQYRKAMQGPFDKRLEKATASRQDQSMTSARAMQINYKKIPSFEEIQSRGTYSLKEATTELCLLEAQKLWNQVFIFQNGQEYAIEADFKNLQDLERQRLMLKALHYLYEAREQKPISITIRHAEALDFSILKNLVHKDLRRLDLSYCPKIKDKTIQTVARCPQLEELHLEGCRGIEKFDAPFLSLKRLNLGRCPNLSVIKVIISLDELRINHCPRLVRVDVPFREETRVNWNGSPNIKGWIEKMVREEEARQNAIKNAIDRWRVRLDGKAELSLKNASKDRLDRLDGLSRRAELSLEDESDASALAEALKLNTSITNINLYDNEIGEAGASALAEALKVNTSITDINLKLNQIGDAGASTLAESLKVNTSIINITLGHNHIGDAGALALAEALKVNTSITNIDLGANQIYGAGVSALAEALKASTSISYIKLDRNWIDEASVSALAEALKVNASITHINLEYNKISFAGASALAEVLKVNTSITNINLDENYIGDDQRHAIEALVRRNQSLGYKAFQQAQSGDPQLLAFLESGLSLYGSDGKNNTLVHITARNGHVKLVEALLQRSRNPTFIHWKNKEDKTALNLAEQNRHADVIQILRQWGAK